MNDVLGIQFSPHSEAELVSIMTSTQIPRGAGTRTIITANVDHVVRLPEDVDFRDAYRRAWVVTADGFPVYAYAKLRGAGPPERVAGSDLVKSLLEALDPTRDRLFFVVSDVATAEQLQNYLFHRGFSLEAIGWAVPPRGFERLEGYSDWLLRRIGNFRTTHLVFGLGAPKSEVWINKHRDRLGDCYAMAVGAGLEFFARTKRRAPVWMRKGGVEWLWRLCQEPQRLWWRYVNGGWRFFRLVRKDIVAR